MLGRSLRAKYAAEHPPIPAPTTARFDILKSSIYQHIVK
jgi:hypothetical protein